jgi:hypothetical protein
MTTRTRYFLAIAVAVLVVGVGTGLLASYYGAPGLSLLAGSDPDEFGYVPANAKVLAYADVHQIMTSDLRQKFREMHPQSGGDSDIEAQTGINVETDIDHVVAATLDGATTGQRPLILARGRFDEVRIESLIRQKGGRVEDYKGKRLFILPETNQPAPALTFAEPGLAIGGEVSAVRLAIDTHAGSRNITDNAELMALVHDVDDGNAWAAGRFDALSNAGRMPPNLAGQLPPINLFAVKGLIDGGIRATVRAETRDAAGAQNLRQVIQGFVALGRMQSGSNAPLAAVINSVELGGEGTTVALSFAIPADALNLLIRQAPARRQAALGF